MPKHKKHDSHPDNYLDDLKEWGDQQYNSGYWTGGKIPPYAKYGGRAMGVAFLLIGLVCLLPIYNVFKEPGQFMNLIYALIFGGVFILAGIRRIAGGKKKK